MEAFLKLDIEKKLEDEYVPRLQRMMRISPSEARSVFRKLLQKAKNESVDEGTANLPENFGDVLLEKESVDGKVKSWLAMKRNEGVRDEDIRLWWNRHDLERRIALEFEDLTRSTEFLRLRDENSVREEEAEKLVEKIFPTYGDPNEPSLQAGNDRPLPYELKDRVERYLESQARANPGEYQREAGRSSTLNAFIRREIKKGNI
ncbi:MAG: hypothetical protein GTO24_21630 [candidate division Zixibacteria bacterium]|nr:hypothetical protein [candidate division Zixibacteria bacterium]